MGISTINGPDESCCVGTDGLLLPSASQCYLSTHLLRMRVHMAIKPRSPKWPWPLDSEVMKMKKAACRDQWNRRNSIEFVAPHPLLESRRTS